MKYRIVDGPDGPERYICDDRPVESPPVDETCGNCRFWDVYRNHDGSNAACGNCRFMPKMVEKLDFEWCGQWQKN